MSVISMNDLDEIDYAVRNDKIDELIRLAKPDLEQMGFLFFKRICQSDCFHFQEDALFDAISNN